MFVVELCNFERRLNLAIRWQAKSRRTVFTAKKILERLGIQTLSAFVKILEPIGVYMAQFFSSRNYFINFLAPYP